MAAQVIRYVDTDVVGGAGDGTSWANAYSTLNAALAAEDKDITAATGTDEQYTFLCRASGGTAEPATITVNFFWVTAVDNYVEIIGVDFPIDGIWDPTAYRIENPNQTHTLLCYPSFVRFVNIQMDIISAIAVTRNGYYFVLQAAGSDVRMDSCITRATLSGASNKFVCGVNCADGDLNLTIYNSIFYGFLSAFGNPSAICFNTLATADMYNCTVYGCTIGIRRLGGTVTVTNTISGNNGNDFNGAMTIDYCLSDDGDGGHAQAPSGGDWDNEMVDPDNGDFTAVASGNWQDNGTDDPAAGLYDDDILGNLRGSPWGIGAYQLAGGGGGAAGNALFMGSNF